MIGKLLLVATLSSAIHGCSTLGEYVQVYFAPADQDTMLRVAYCESSADADDIYSTAVNPKSGATGWFQHLPKWWGERSKAAGMEGRSMYDPEANVAVASFLYYGMNSNKRWGGLSHWYPSWRCIQNGAVWE